MGILKETVSTYCIVLEIASSLLTRELSSAEVVTSSPVCEEANVVSFHLKLSNGIEINKEKTNLDGLTRLLQSLSALCLGLKSHMNFYLCHGSVDMRKGIVSLSELVRRKMNASPENGYYLQGGKICVEIA